MCSGTLVGNHCIRKFDIIIITDFFYFRGPLEDIRVQLGFTETDDTTYIERNVTDLEPHPKYSNNGEQQGFDIALLKLDESLTFQKNVSPICLPTEGESFTGSVMQI